MGNNSWIHPPFFSLDLVAQNVRNMSFLFIFSILGRSPKKINGLLTSPNNQFRDYHIWNRIEKLMPQHWIFAPQTLKSLQKTTNLFANLGFLQKSGFPKTRDLSPATPLGRYISRNDTQKKKISEMAKTSTISIFV